MRGEILLLEDDRLFGETLADFLHEEGFAVSRFTEADSALEAMYGERRFDLYLLDVNVPGMDGFSLLEQLRAGGDETPAIFVTSSKEKEALGRGFRSGADDYLKKPVDLDELLWRIEAQLRRGVKKARIAVGEYTFDTGRNVLYLGDEPIPLPRKLAELLGLLLRHRGEVVTTAEILEEIYGEEDPGTGVLRVYINKLKKLFGKESIRNIRGVGYCFEA